MRSIETERRDVLSKLSLDQQCTTGSGTPRQRGGSWLVCIGREDLPRLDKSGLLKNKGLFCNALKAWSAYPTSPYKDLAAFSVIVTYYKPLVLIDDTTFLACRQGIW